MKRRSGADVATVLTYCVGVILALGSIGLLFLGGMLGTGADSGDRVSVALTGMALAAGSGLLLLAGLVWWLRFGMPEWREWARNGSFDYVTSSFAVAQAAVRGLRGAARSVATAISTSASHFSGVAFPSRSKSRKPSYRPSA
jgi:hypothetical protein